MLSAYLCTSMFPLFVLANNTKSDILNIQRCINGAAVKVFPFQFCSTQQKHVALTLQPVWKSSVVFFLAKFSKKHFEGNLGELNCRRPGALVQFLSKCQ